MCGHLVRTVGPEYCGHVMCTKATTCVQPTSPVCSTLTLMCHTMQAGMKDASLFQNTSPALTAVESFLRGASKVQYDPPSTPGHETQSCLHSRRVAMMRNRAVAHR